jgi:hypothetical protein
VSSRDQTSAQIDWSPPAWKKVGVSGDAQRTPDLTGIVKEIVSQPDWKAGNAMAFLIRGDGRRTAVSSRGRNKDAPRLVIIADLPDDIDNREATTAYELKLFFAAPRGSRQPRKFRVHVQNAGSPPHVTLNPDDPSHHVLTLPSVQIGRRLHVAFDATEGQPVLSGIKLQRQ